MALSSFSFFTAPSETNLASFKLKMQEGEEVIIVGAGPSGLAMAATLTLNSIPYVLLERDDCYAPLWKKSSYDRLHLHLPKHFCQLPHMSFPPNAPKYVPKGMFLTYLDDYVSNFKINPMYRRSVQSAKFDEVAGKWKVTVKYMGENEADEEEEYVGKFLVVATGETTDAFVPEIEGSENFNGEVLHTTQYKNGKGYKDKSVLVVGSGNSGMEIALDLANHGAKTSIVIRSPIHILSRTMAHMGLFLFNFLPFNFVESLLVALSKLKYGNLTKYGIERPQEGPFLMKENYGKYPVVDVGTVRKIKSGEIQVLPAIARIRGHEVEFEDGKTHPFDVIMFATGFKRSTNKWLQGDDYLLNEDGLPKPRFPNHWKGKNNVYCVGLARRGFYGISADARNIADDIKSLL